MLAAAPAVGADALKPYAGFSQDGKHVLILVPADRLDNIQREMASAPDLNKDVMIVMPFEQFSRVVDVAAIDQRLSGQSAASSDISPSREQTSVQTSESIQTTTQSTQSSAPAAGSHTSAAGSTAASQALMQPSSPTQSSIAQSGSGYPAPAGPGGTIAGGTSSTTDQTASASGSSLPSGSSAGMMAQSGTGSTSTITTTEQTTSTYSSQSSAATPSASSSARAFPSFDDKAILLVPHDQLGSVSQAAGSDREILVVIPYDKFHQVADLSKLQSSEQAASSAAPSREQTSASSTTTPTTTESAAATSGDRMAWSEFHRNHVMMLVPADRLKNFSQISTTGDRPIYVVMPLDQFNRVVAVKTSSLEPSREQTSFQPASATTTTTTTTTALPPAYGESRTFFLHNLQEANSVLQWEPAAGGTIVTLRDGSVLMVPDSVKIRGALQTGARVRGEYEQRGGQNLVTWLEVLDITNNKSD
jgi:hypothetical protein